MLSSEKFEEIKEKAGSSNRYQYIVLLFATMLWWTCNLMSISLPYLEMTHKVQFIDKNTQKETTSQYTYSLCNENQSSLKNIDSTHHSWVISFNLQCEKTKTGLIGSFTFMGVMIGSLLFTFSADKLGRKKTIIIGGMGVSIILAMFNLAFNIYIIYALVFFLQIFAFFGILGGYLYCMEIVSPKRRAIFSAIVNSGFSLGGFFFILSFKYINSWKITFDINAIINAILTIFLIFFTVESPNYYFTKDNSEGLEKSIRYIAKVNHKPDSEIDNIFNEIKNDLEKETSKIQTDYSGHENSPLLKLKTNKNNHNFWTLLKYPSQRYNFLIMCFLWMSTAGTYYGITIYLKNLPGDIYINGIFIYGFELISYFISSYMIDLKLFGRKKTFLVFEAINLIGCLVILTILKENDSYIKTCFFFIMWFALSSMYNITFTYTNEVYATVVKAKGFGINSICARISNILIPILIELLENDIMIVFCGLAGLSFIFIMFLPETRGKKVSNNIPEEEIIH